MRSTVLDHWRWCIKLSLPIEEDCHEVWYKWLEDESLTAKEYSIFLAALAATYNKEGAISLAEEVVEHYRKSDIPNQRDEDGATVFWNSVLSVYAKQGTGPNAGEDAVEMLAQIPDPNDRSYSIAMEALAGVAPMDSSAAATAADLFAQMIPKTDQVAVTHAFVHLLRAHSKSQQTEGAQLAWDLLQGAVEDYLQQTTPDETRPVPNQHAFAAVIAGFCRRKEYEAASHVMERLQALHQQTGDNQHFSVSAATFNKILDATPSVKLLRSFDGADTVSYNTVLVHLNKSKDPEAATLSYELLQEMKGRGLKPDKISFTAVLHAVKDPHVAEKVFQDFLMVTGHHPSVTIFNAIMSVWAESRRDHPEAPVRVQMYFDQLRGRFISTGGRTQPTRKSYGLLLKCLGKNGAAASRVLNIMYEDLLRHNNELAKPTRATFHTVMEAWRRGMNIHHPEKAVFRIESLLRQMQTEHDSRGWDVKPNRGSFLILLKTLAFAGSEATAERAESVLQYMQRDADDRLNPDSMCYSTVMDAWFRAGPEHSLRAQALYQEMQRRWQEGDENFTPHLFTYGMMLKIWASSSHPQAASKADEVYQHMKSRSDGKVAPGVWHVTTLMDAHAASGNCARVHELMENELQIPPERVHYNILLKSYARSPDTPNAAEKAASIMEIMRDTQRPDTVTYTTFLKVLQNSRREDAYETSKEVVNGMLELLKTGETSVTPSANTWTVLLETLLNASHMSNESKRLEVAWMEPYILENDEKGEKLGATRYWIQRIRDHSGVAL